MIFGQGQGVYPRETERAAAAPPLARFARLKHSEGPCVVCGIMSSEHRAPVTFVLISLWYPPDCTGVTGRLRLAERRADRLLESHSGPCDPGTVAR